MIFVSERAAAAGLSGGHQALGGGGLVHWLIRLVIWHELWHVVRIIWRIPTFGPIIVVVIVLAVIGLAVLSRRGVGRTRRARSGSGRYGTGTGPRDW